MNLDSFLHSPIFAQYSQKIFLSIQLVTCGVEVDISKNMFKIFKIFLYQAILLKAFLFQKL